MFGSLPEKSIGHCGISREVGCKSLEAALYGVFYRGDQPVRCM